MNDLFARYLDGCLRVYEIDAAAEGLLQAVRSVPVGAGLDVCGLAVAPQGDRIVYATTHEFVCLGRDGTELWRYALLPRSTEKYGHRPSAAFSPDGTLLWVYRPDAMAGRGSPDTWVVLDAWSGEVRAQADLGSCGHGGEHLPLPDGSRMLLDVGEGQDGSLVFAGSLKGKTLEVERYPWDDRCVMALAPGGGQFMSIDHGQADVAFHECPSGEVVLTLPVAVFGHDPESATFEWSGGYLDADTAVVTICGEREEDDVADEEREWYVHYRVDLRTGGVTDRFDAHSRHSYDLEPLGDGSWLTSDPDGRPLRWMDRRETG
ncbi:hypothetical protein BKA00_006652 [Actinomadura coerulea]|uniref:WD40 repeat domain-containing protein n=1 Tax=Actinomadura coerulea TaxID=46159 RepID=A0A7X0L2K4_9ACTN|nr:hypothetical protein [Actinomadura coerulea]MBB6399738.1 hypothetical protein [Actinomadura coerulea]